MTTAATELQNGVVEKSLASIRAGSDVLIEAPTGAGKTRIFSLVADALEKDDKTILVLAHLKNLVKQSADRYARWNGENAANTSQGMDGIIDQSGKVIFSTVQTASKLSDDLKKIDVLVIDEAHHATMEHIDYKNLIDALSKANPNLQIVAVTATPPEKLEGLHPRLSAAEHHVITYEEAIAAKLVDLADTVVPNVRMNDGRSIPDIIDQHRKGRTTTDIETGVAAEIRRNLPADWVSQQADQFERHLGNRQTLAFFDSIKDANAFAAEVQDRGYNIEVVHSNRRDKDNDAAMDGYRAGSVQIIASVDMLSEGIDVPDSSGVFLGKLSTSKKEFQQIHGRAARSMGEDKVRKSRLVDMGSSTYLHGDIGAQAAVQSLRGGMDQQTVTADDLLPDSKGGKAMFWIQVNKDKADQPAIFATTFDNNVIYATKTEKGYATMMSRHNAKGGRLELLEVAGARKGMIDDERFKEWISGNVRSHERALARMMAPMQPGRESKSRLQTMVETDYGRNANSVMQNIKLLTMVASLPKTQGAHFAAQAAGRGR